MNLSRHLTKMSYVVRLGDLMATSEQIHTAATRHLSKQQAAHYLELIRPAARLDHAGAAQTRSRLGGSPIMSDDWPTWEDTPLTLLAVLDLEDFQGVDTGLQLPTAGWLNFFYDAESQAAWGFDPTQSDAWRVMYAEPGSGRETPPPPDVEQFEPVGLTITPEFTLPDPFEPCFDGYSKRERRRLFALDEELREEGWPDRALHQVGGWPDLVQNPIWLECQLASNGIYVGDPSGYRHPRAPELEAGASEWQLLFQIDTDDAVGWMWGDVGKLYYAIRRSDLANRRFDRTWMVLQCS